MLRQDYIMKMIEQLVRVLAETAGLRRSKQYNQALRMIDETLQQLTSLDSRLINSLSDDSLITLLKTGDVLDGDKVIIIADLLKAEAEIYEAQDQVEESYYRYLKSLHLFLTAFLSNSPTNLPNHFLEIEPILAKLEPYELPAEAKQSLWRYYEKMSQYARAEDVLYELIEGEPAEDEWLEQGIAFYRRLLQKRDQELVAGNLPRAEIEAGLAELLELKSN